MILGFGLMAPPSISLAAEGTPPQGSVSEPSGTALQPRPEHAVVVRGKLLKFDDRVYTVETGPGTQTDMRVNKLTKFDGDYKGIQGDWIEANVSQDGSILWLKKSSPGYTLEGDILKVEGDVFVVKDVSGKEIRLKGASDAKVVGSHKVGERIRAEYAPDGKVLSIKPAKQMGGAGAAGP
jgi:hypothetical protein